MLGFWFRFNCNYRNRGVHIIRVRVRVFSLPSLEPAFSDMVGGCCVQPKVRTRVHEALAFSSLQTITLTLTLTLTLSGGILSDRKCERYSTFGLGG